MSLNQYPEWVKYNELNVVQSQEIIALKDRIKRLEEENNELRAEEARLLNTNGELERRIKRLEEVGDEMLNWLTDDGISVENLRLIANAWHKAKEAKL